MGSISACAKLGVESLRGGVFSADEQPSKRLVNPTIKPAARRKEESGNLELNLCTKNPQARDEGTKLGNPFSMKENRLAGRSRFFE